METDPHRYSFYNNMVPELVTKEAEIAERRKTHGPQNKLERFVQKQQEKA